MYKCQQCGEKAEVQKEQIVCTACDYTILKIIVDRDNLLEAAREIVIDFVRYGEVLQKGDNGEYGAESPIGRLTTAVNNLDNIYV